MGTLYHTLFNKNAFDYIAMSMMGFDACVFGNHDFDGGIAILSDAMKAFTTNTNNIKEINEELKPVFISSNLKFYCSDFWKSKVCDGDNIYPYYIFNLKRSDSISKPISVGVAALMGDDAISCVVESDSLLADDMIESAQKVIGVLKQHNPDFIILLSHSGSSWVNGKQIVGEDSLSFSKRAKSEDGLLAESVLNVDAIISGHDHVVLHKPLIVNNIPIVSSGNNLNFLGKLVIDKSINEISYDLIPITDSIEPDSVMAKWVLQNKSYINSAFFNLFGVNIYDTICSLPAAMSINPSNVDAYNLGRFIANSYVSVGIENITNEYNKCSIFKSNFHRPNLDNVIAIVPYGTIRDSLKRGVITGESVFNVLPLGTGLNGNLYGYPLVIVWLTGKELRDICELNVSVAAPTSDMRLFFSSNLTYKYNSFKLPLTRVTDVLINNVEVYKDSLYPVISDRYTAELIGLLKSSSFGVLSAVIKDCYGQEVSNLDNQVIYLDNGISNNNSYLPGWLAVIKYLQQNSDSENNISKLYNATNNYETEENNLFVVFIYLLIAIAFIVVLVLLARLFKTLRLRSRKL
jgi:5''-nucleotidase/2'',3''-cyclic phosphodiesterase and related esterases